MFYHGKLLNGNNVVKDEFRPAYLNGSNTEKLPAERASNFLDDYNDISDTGESHVSATTSSTPGSSSAAASSSSGNAISSFQETLNRMKNASNDKIQKDINNKKEREKVEENRIEREKQNLDVTLKPFLFFDLLTSKDSSSQNKEVSQSLSNIGMILIFMSIILTSYILFFDFFEILVLFLCITNQVYFLLFLFFIHPNFDVCNTMLSALFNFNFRRPPFSFTHLSLLRLFTTSLHHSFTIALF